MTARIDRRRAARLIAALAWPWSVRAQPAKGAPAAARGVQGWPSRPVRLLVGFPPGSVQDLSARAIAPALSSALGQPVVVDNKAGASGTIAADQVARATDLHTFGVMNNSQLTTARLLNPATAYDPARDLTPIGLIATTPLLLVVPVQARGEGPREWLAWIEHQGDAASYGSPGVGTPGHLGFELLKSRTALRTRHIPYAGNPQVITAILGGQLQAGLMPPGLVQPQVQSGRLKAVAVTSEGRSALAPEHPTLRELGVLGAEVELWSALAGPRNLRRDLVQHLGDVLVSSLREAGVRQALLAAGWQASPGNHEALAARMQADTRLFGRIIVSRGIRSDS